MSACDVYEVHELDPPVPVRIPGFREHPPALLLRWVRHRDGWSEGRTAIVRYRNDTDTETVEGGVRPGYLDDDVDRRTFRLTSPAWTHDEATCVFRTCGGWMRNRDGSPRR